MPNDTILLELNTYEVDVDSVESVSGFDFFYQLNDELEEKLESESDFQRW